MIKYELSCSYEKNKLMVNMFHMKRKCDHFYISYRFLNIFYRRYTSVVFLTKDLMTEIKDVHFLKIRVNC